MGSLFAALVGNASSRSGDPMITGVASLPLDLLRAYPGAAFVADLEGPVGEIGGADPERAAALRREASRTDLDARIVAAIERAAVSIEILPIRGECPIEATLLPLGDGRRALVLLRPLEFAAALHRSLIDSRQRYKNFVEAASDFCWETDEVGRFTFVSPEGALGWSPREMVGHRVGEFMVAPDRGETTPQIFRTTGLAQNDDIWFRAADGTGECLDVFAAPILDADGNWRGSRGLCRKVTERRRRDREAAQARLYGQLATHLAHTSQEEDDPQAALVSAVATVGLAICAIGGVVLHAPDGEGLVEVARWGEGPVDTLVQRAAILLAGGAEIDDLCGDQHLLGVATSCRGAANGVALFWRPLELGLFTDDDRPVIEAAERPIGASIARLASLEKTISLSRVDPLTGMLNRRAFHDEVARRIERLTPERRPAALFFVDLNNFKLVNDVQGHKEGDAILIDTAAILRESARSSDVVGRLGGDEFVLWLDGADGPAATERAAAILARLTGLADRTGDPARPFGASIGIAVLDPARAETIDQLLTRADIAMYRAKRQKTGYAVAEAGEVAA